jgi:type II secretory ATPase GspE/PulE/Tfp pilus assembly ATPase PilB-like protein
MAAISASVVLGVWYNRSMSVENVVTASAPDARPIVDHLLGDAVRRGASDIHIEPTANGYEVRLRIDGLLEKISKHDVIVGRSIVTRLMVMAHLLTYRLDIPQEGRLTTSVAASAMELDLRLAIMPTTHGLRAAVRLPAELIQPRTLEELNLPTSVMDGLRQFVAAEEGMLIVTGPAGSGKTTTIYALLQYIAQHSSGLSIIALEDPVERNLEGVTQIEVSPFGQLTYERALRSILRQDPQVLMLGEIRDAATATLALQAALSGHRLICTFHAVTAGGAISRLIEMGAEPYQITSAIFGVASQRLLRRKEGDGYRGRVPAAEFVRMDPALRAAVLRRADAADLQQIYEKQPGFQHLRDSAADLVTRGLTDNAEVQRALGPDKIPPAE